MHPEARIVYTDAEKSPFFIQKLAIKVLPCIICFVDGIAVDRVVGFSDFNDKDDFDTIELIRRLVKAGVLTPKNKMEKGNITTVKRGRGDSDDDGDDTD